MLNVFKSTATSGSLGLGALGSGKGILLHQLNAAITLPTADAGFLIDHEQILQVDSGDSLTDGLLAALPIREGVGTTTADISGQNRHATLTVSNWERGLLGQAIKTTLLNTSVGIPSDSDLLTNDAFTVSVWAKLLTTSPNYGSLVGKRDLTPAGWVIYRFNNFNYLELYLATSFGTMWARYTNTTVVDDAYHNIIFQINGNKFYLYADGELQIPVSGGAGITLPDTYSYGIGGVSSPGMLALGGPTGANGGYNDYVDERAWNRILSSAEIKRLANSPFVGYNVHREQIIPIDGGADFQQKPWGHVAARTVAADTLKNIVYRPTSPILTRDLNIEGFTPSAAEWYVYYEEAS